MSGVERIAKERQRQIKEENFSVQEDEPLSDTGMLPWPKEWPIVRNPSEICDMVTGPCACGAWHQFSELEKRLGR